MTDYKERYEEELNIPDTNPHLGTNIKQLRIEKRYKLEEFAKILNVEESTVKKWEEGKVEPSKQQIKQIVEILKISYYDIMTRDIFSERKMAEKKMKLSKERRNYNWYYGDKTRIILYLIYLIGIPMLFGVLLICGDYLNQIFVNTYLYSVLGTNTKYLISYAGCSIVSGIIITIRLSIYFKYRFQIWHLFWITLLCWLVFIIGLIGFIPYYIYIVISLIIKKGRNHI